MFKKNAPLLPQNGMYDCACLMIGKGQAAQNDPIWAKVMGKCTNLEVFLMYACLLPMRLLAATVLVLNSPTCKTVLSSWGSPSLTKYSKS